MDTTTLTLINLSLTTAIVSIVAGYLYEGGKL